MQLQICYTYQNTKERKHQESNWQKRKIANGDWWGGAKDWHLLQNCKMGWKRFLYIKTLDEKADAKTKPSYNN